MTIGITMVVGSLALSAVILIVYWYFKRLLPAKQVQRIQLQQKIRQFALSVQQGDIDQDQITAFWADTQHSYALGSTFAINDLRNQLYDKATVLLQTRRSLASADTTLKRRNELLQLHSDTIRWFSGSLTQMDSLFYDEIDPVVTVQDVCSEIIRVLGRSIRA